MHKRIILFLILSAMAFVPSWAERYLSEVVLTSCYKGKDVEKTKKELTDKGYSVILTHLNDGTPGITFYYVFLGYKMTSDPRQAITLLAVTNSTCDGKSEYSDISYGSMKYDLKPAKCFGASNGDMNQGAGGWYLYLYYSKSHAGELNADMYRGLDISVSTDEATPMFRVKDKVLSVKETVANLNQGHLGTDLYLKASKHRHDITIEQIANDEVNHQYRCTNCNLSMKLQHLCNSFTENRDQNNHWGTCIVCQKVLKKQAHSFLRSSTSEEEHSRVCSVCHYIINNAHTFGSYQIVDDEHHMYVCSDAMCNYSHMFPHRWNSTYKTILEANFEHAGIAEYTCLDCQATRRESLPQLTDNTPEYRESTSDSDDEFYTPSSLLPEESIEEQAPVTLTVYSLQGKCLLRQATWDDLLRLPHGAVYIVNGKKVKL